MLINQYANVPILIRLIFIIGKLAYSKIGTFICGSSSVDRALAFQAEGRGFESRLPLSINKKGTDSNCPVPFFILSIRFFIIQIHRPMPEFRYSGIPLSRVFVCRIAVPQIRHVPKRFAVSLLCPDN